MASTLEIPEDMEHMSAEEVTTFMNNVIDRMRQLENMDDLTSLLECCGAFEKLFEVCECERDDDFYDAMDEVVDEQKFGDLSSYLLKHLKARRPIEDASEDQVLWNVYTKMLLNVWNLTDKSKTFTVQLTTPEVADFLGDNLNLTFENEKTQFVLEASIQILHNIVRQPGNAQAFTRDAIKKRLAEVTSAKENHNISVGATLCLAYLVNEDEREMLEKGVHTINIILEYIEEAANDDYQTCSGGYSLKELLSALASLVMNDNINKILIDREGSVDLLKKLCDVEHPKQLKYATKIIWKSLFNKENCEKLRTASDLQSFLEKLQEQVAPLTQKEIDSVKENIKGALWLLRGELQKSPTEASAPAQPSPEVAKRRSAAVPKPVTKKPEVFISYCWNNKADVLKVHQRLRECNISCWLDVEQMHGSTLEAMADGIDGATTVLICYSEAYRNSANCRMEAEYALQQRKNIIPLCMQTKYKPTGWLGFIIGAKLYYDFSGAKDFDSIFTQFFPALQELLGGDPAVAVSAGGAPVAADVKEPKIQETKAHSTATGRERPSPQHVQKSAAVSLKSEVLSWTCEQVSDWLKAQKFSTQVVDSFAGVDGKLLARLLQLQSQAPEFYFNSLRNEFHLSMKDLLVFCIAVEETLAA